MLLHFQIKSLKFEILFGREIARYKNHFEMIKKIFF